MSKSSLNQDLPPGIRGQLSESEQIALNKCVQDAENRYFSKKKSPLSDKQFDDVGGGGLRPAVEWAIAALPIPVILAAIFLELYAVYAASIWAILSAILILVWAQSNRKHTQLLS